MFFGEQLLNKLTPEQAQSLSECTKADEIMNLMITLKPIQNSLHLKNFVLILKRTDIINEKDSFSYWNNFFINKEI